MVFAVTEGGETSSVIGTILTASKEYKQNELEQARKKLYYVYNNNDDVLIAYDRCKSVIENPLITKISLCTG